MSLDILLWAFLASYVIHLVDETTMNGGFILWIKTSFWPTYTGRMNFWFNSGAVLGITVSNLLADLFGGHCVILVTAEQIGNQVAYRDAQSRTPLEPKVPPPRFSRPTSTE